MYTPIHAYASAVTAGHITEIAATLHPEIVIMPPGSNQPNVGKQKASMMLSAVAAVVSDFTVVHQYQSEDGWYGISLSGMIEDTNIQFIDQVHLDENNLIDHMDIFLRPASMAEKLLGKVTEEIKKRTAAPAL